MKKINESEMLQEAIQILKEKTIGDVIFFEISIKERPHITTYSYKGAKKSQHDDLNIRVESLDLIQCLYPVYRIFVNAIEEAR